MILNGEYVEKLTDEELALSPCSITLNSPLSTLNLRN